MKKRYNLELKIAVEIAVEKGQRPEDVADLAVENILDKLRSGEVEFVTDVGRISETSPRKGPM